MKIGVVLAIGLCSVLWSSTAVFASPPPTHAPAALPHAHALEPALQRSEMALLQRRMQLISNQQAQLKALKGRVNTLEKNAASNRAALEQRNREIAELERKLAAMSALRESHPAPPSSR